MLSILALTGALALGAEPAPRTPRAADWDLYGALSLRAEQLGGFALDATGTPSEMERWLTSRARLGGSARATDWLRLVVEVEAFSGLLAGDTTTVGQGIGVEPFRFDRDERFGAATFRPRLAYAELALPFGVLRVGQQAFTWGTGMLAHDGAAEPDFGDVWQGSLVERVLLATRPTDALTVFVAGDLVFSDDNADWQAGDRAYAALAGARLSGETLRGGALASMRWQTDRADPLRPDGARSTVEVLALDGYVAAEFDPFRLEAEVAGLVGSTTRPYLEETVADGADVRSFGALVRARYDDTAARLTVKLEGGYASGDDDPQDATARQFSMNSDHQVGLVLFEHVLPLMSARSVDRITDPDLSGEPPSGLRFTVAQGAVGNAWYGFPRARWRPLEWLDLRLGYLFAASAGDLIDPYQSARAGGFNATYGGRQPGGHVLGHEIDGAVRASLALPGGLSLSLGAEAGLFVAGAAFDGVPGLDSVLLARGLGEVRW